MGKTVDLGSEDFVFESCRGLHSSFLFQALKRHLNIRMTIDLDSYVDKVELEEDDLAKYVPIDVFGQNHPEDNKVFMFERTGKIDISGLVDNVLVGPVTQISFNPCLSDAQIHANQAEDDGKRPSKSGSCRAENRKAKRRTLHNGPRGSLVQSETDIGAHWAVPYHVGNTVRPLSPTASENHHSQCSVFRECAPSSMLPVLAKRLQREDCDNF